MDTFVKDMNELTTEEQGEFVSLNEAIKELDL